ncbi:MAG: ABC transporter permease [Myxococcota bacterium]
MKLRWSHVDTVARTAVDLVSLLGAVLLRSRNIEPAEALRHAYQIGNRSALLVTVVMGFVGAILVVQASTQALRIVGDLSTIGPGFLQLLVREFGPTIIALMVAARAGAGIAAELGAMSITEQVDALRLSGAEPVAYLVAPRVLGGLLGMVPLVLWGTLVAYLAGGVVMTQRFGIAWQSYVGLQLVAWSDLSVGLSKAMAYGLAVPLVASRSGLLATGGAPGVGRATTRAVIDGSLAILLLDLVIGTIGHLVAR